MNINEKLKTVRDALTKAHSNVYHYCGEDASGNDYIIWQEDGEGDSLHLDNTKNVQVITGTIDMFTFKEYNPLVDNVQKVLNDASISFVLNSVQFEEETQLIHYEWKFEI